MATDVDVDAGCSDGCSMEDDEDDGESCNSTCRVENLVLRMHDADQGKAHRDSNGQDEIYSGHSRVVRAEKGLGQGCLLAAEEGVTTDCVLHLYLIQCRCSFHSHSSADHNKDRAGTVKVAQCAWGHTCGKMTVMPRSEAIPQPAAGGMNRIHGEDDCQGSWEGMNGKNDCFPGDC